MQIDAASVVVLQEDVQLRQYPQGHLVCAFGTNQAFEVNGVGALLLWNLRSPMAVKALIDQVAHFFTQPAGVLRDDVMAFVAECLELNILRLCNTTGEAEPR